MAAPSMEKKDHLTPLNNIKDPDDLEEWEDDQVITPVDAGDQVELCQPPITPEHRHLKPASSRCSRLSTAKVRRLKSRQRQNAQNAKAGIRLITDMSALRWNNHTGYHAKSPMARKGKFVDAAALRALEGGEPNAASVGHSDWLKKNNNSKSLIFATTTKVDRSKDQELSPEDRPIVIGISLPPSDVQEREISPDTAIDGSQHQRLEAAFVKTHGVEEASIGANSSAQKSVWSPDTPDTSFSFSPGRAASSTYSQAHMPNQYWKEENLPPVPDLPSGYGKMMSHTKTINIELGKSPVDESECGTPYTLFEEDGSSSPQRCGKAKGLDFSPDSASSKSHGWWDHIVTPFVDKTMSFSTCHPKGDPPKEPGQHKLWPCQHNQTMPAHSPKLLTAAIQPPLVRAPTPRWTPSPSFGSKRWENKGGLPIAAGPSTAAAPRIIVTRDSLGTSDCPPPYSPRQKPQVGNPIRYRAVFPPGHPLHSLFPPSPRPASPGLAATMTSQGRVCDTVDLTPALMRTHTPPVISEPLPVRPIGTFVPQEHAYSVGGRRHKVERQRRRHEKEDIISRRAGGLWRGRGCMPSKGCFGRTGREGRKRRRVWMAIWGGITAVLLLIILLAALLTRHHGLPEVPSIWVNLTSFPPMPTGVLTVVGPDNTAAKSVCTEPSTLWSCSVPKDQQSSAAPYKPNQPTLIMQIQWDNGTSRTWDVPNGDAPRAVARRADSAASFAAAILRRVQTQFRPSPAAPKPKEMWFLGETTDNIKSDQKAGEPAPFYISLLKSVNERTVPPATTPQLTRRGSSPDIGNDTFRNLIPPPDVEADGTSVPAQMMPNPVHQPVRLYDRGLPTEHYGFYTYFKKTIFLKSVSIQNQTNDTIPLDEDGGCRKTEASYVVTWGETRLRVQIWTRLLDRNTSSLLRPDGGKDIKGGGGTGELVRPGTMPYPVTITHDTHGGDPNKKLVWGRPINDRLQVQKDSAIALINDMGRGGTWINPRDSGDGKYGGFDGGTGGCRCEWVNWV